MFIESASLVACAFVAGAVVGWLAWATCASLTYAARCWRYRPALRRLP